MIKKEAVRRKSRTKIDETLLDLANIGRQKWLKKEPARRQRRTKIYETLVDLANR